MAPHSNTLSSSKAEDESRHAALKVDGLWKVFGMSGSQLASLAEEDRTTEKLASMGAVGAVQDASFSVHQGEVFVVMGLSGSGKSTLLRCLTRLIEPSAGNITIAGQDLVAAGEKDLIDIRRKHIGMVFQHFALLPNRTVMSNIAFPLEVQGVGRDETEKKVRQLIELVGLTGREGRYPSELSGGQQQRIGIARSLATDPDFWLLDEPFSALDPLIRTDLQDELLRLQKTLAKTVVFITHDLDEAIRIADRVAIMENGRIIQIGTPEELVTRPATDYVRRFVAKVSPSKVVRVRSIMESFVSSVENSSTSTNVQADSTIEEIAPLLMQADDAFSVVNDTGKKIGSLDRMKALSVLTRANSIA
ncbi:MAG: betaine/proline/choline family ABC transporter ATP-binding protein [Pseudomonadota bacterium]